MVSMVSTTKENPDSSNKKINEKTIIFNIFFVDNFLQECITEHKLCLHRVSICNI
jgi:hypothetical protein